MHGVKRGDAAASDATAAESDPRAIAGGETRATAGPPKAIAGGEARVGYFGERAGGSAGGAGGRTRASRR